MIKQNSTESAASQEKSSSPTVADIALRQAQHARAIQARALMHIAGEEKTYVPIEQLRAISDIVREQAGIEWERMKYLEVQEQKQSTTPTASGGQPTHSEMLSARREWTRRHAT